jgi:hypothetical protein
MRSGAMPAKTAWALAMTSKALAMRAFGGDDGALGRAGPDLDGGRFGRTFVRHERGREFCS